MSKLYPLLLKPEFHERVWGSRDISAYYPEAPRLPQPIGEVWLTGDACRVANGPLAGKSLAELAKEFGADFLGAAAPDLSRFPLLIKFLFPQDKLSVQVHPDDEGARRIGQPCGKTECWYVLAAEPGAKVGLGLKPGTTHEAFEQAIRETRAEELLNWIAVHPGELIYVDAGTVHAIGPGAVLVETQQNSDTTYRLYDYGRPRELHVREGLAATKTKTSAGKVKPRETGGSTDLVSSACFIVDKHKLSTAKRFEAEPGKSSVQIVVTIAGSGSVGETSFSRGDAVVIPAALGAFEIRPEGELETLRMRLPGAPLPPPETIL